jgi:hypothetical protein
MLRRRRIYLIRCAATSFALDHALLSDQIQQISEPEPGFKPSDLLLQKLVAAAMDSPISLTNSL